MCCLRIFFSMTLALILILSPNTYAKGKRTKETLHLVAEKLQSYKTFSDAVAAIKLSSPTTGRKLEEYLKSKGFWAEKLAPWKIVDEAIIIGSNNQGRFTVLENSQFMISWGKSQKVLSNEASFEDLVNALETITVTKTSRLLDFFISDSHAIDPFSVIMATFGVIFAIWGITGVVASISSGVDNARAASEAVTAMCELGESRSVEDLAEAYNVLSDAVKRNVCRSYVNSQMQPCRNLISAQACLQRKINRAMTTNNQGRNAERRNIQFNASDDRYSIPPRGTHQ